MGKQFDHIKHISFDLDGTLVDQEFANLVWHRGIPEVYAEQRCLGLSTAQKIISQEYDKVGDDALEWYDVSYWFEYLGLPGRWEAVLERYSSAVRVYPEVHEVLSHLQGEFRLIVLSNAAREFVDVEMREGGLSEYFERVVSATSDFGVVKKSKDFYRQVCDIVGITPQEMAHVGDHWRFDYQIPRRVGIAAFYLDRRQQHVSEAIKDLRTLEKVLSRKDEDAGEDLNRVP